MPVCIPMKLIVAISNRLSAGLFDSAYVLFHDVICKTQPASLLLEPDPKGLSWVAWRITLMPHRTRNAVVMITAILALHSGLEYTEAQTASPSNANSTDPRKLGWMTGFPPSPDKPIMQPQSDHSSIITRLPSSAEHLMTK